MSRRKDALFIVSMALARSLRTERVVGLEMGLESVQIRTYVCNGSRTFPSTAYGEFFFISDLLGIRIDLC